MVSVSVRCLFCQPMDEEIRTWTVRFPTTENPNIEKALFDWPIVLVQVIACGINTTSDISKLLYVISFNLRQS